ncbi:MAG TPA: hypothetical protein VJJ52_02315 [Candidatus Nanoarchaeia archaeon]|nr:hypothetical protein [Candidatus Nanoarchaeia archaeon]
MNLSRLERIAGTVRNSVSDSFRAVPEAVVEFGKNVLFPQKHERVKAELSRLARETASELLGPVMVDAEYVHSLAAKYNLNPNYFDYARGNLIASITSLVGGAPTPDGREKFKGSLGRVSEVLWSVAGHYGNGSATHNAAVGIVNETYFRNETIVLHMGLRETI